MSKTPPSGGSAASLRLVALTLTKIDGDVIEEFVRHTARFVDRHYIVDLDSPDGTRATLDALLAEGLPLTIWHDQGIEVVPLNVFARIVLDEQDPDYLLLLDPDEFITAADRPVLETALRALPAGANATVPWVTYVPHEDDDESERRVLARIRYRRAAEDRQFFKVFVHRSFASRPDWHIAIGNHDVAGEGAQTAPLPGIRLAHFPVREVRQIQAKALVGFTSMVANGYGDQTGFAYQWRVVYRRLLAGVRWTARDLHRIALDYLSEEPERSVELAYDPLSPVERRHTGPTPELIEVALTFSRQIASAFAESRGLLRATPGGEPLGAAPANEPTR